MSERRFHLKTYTGIPRLGAAPRRPLGGHLTGGHPVNRQPTDGYGDDQLHPQSMLVVLISVSSVYAVQAERESERSRLPPRWVSTNSFSRQSCST